jgi:hypothetical protein
MPMPRTQLEKQGRAAEDDGENQQWRQRAAGVFSGRADAVDVHMMISAFCVFRVANRHTWATLFERDLLDPALRERYRRMLGDMVVDFLTGDELDGMLRA